MLNPLPYLSIISVSEPVASSDFLLDISIFKVIDEILRLSLKLWSILLLEYKMKKTDFISVYIFLDMEGFHPEKH